MNPVHNPKVCPALVPHWCHRIRRHFFALLSYVWLPYKWSAPLSHFRWSTFVAVALNFHHKRKPKDFWCIYWCRCAWKFAVAEEVSTYIYIYSEYSQTEQAETVANLFYISCWFGWTESGGCYVLGVGHIECDESTGWTNGPNWNADKSYGRWSSGRLTYIHGQQRCKASCTYIRFTVSSNIFMYVECVMCLWYFPLNELNFLFAL